ncbi:MAG: exodeoxyribonuclease VII small subunit [Bacteroidetes bacterium GWF2_38_335]|nr:MAG: exodeoxyribonuclease VII small subunit [Bacteroidetes bacterium GWF2_38_335]OFY78978.1 MAG: exodeoxyribonuclease VII small subunit [Bacteroidetes bacterium RIFOXYA12_FULL_38_20]HBS86049.1 exodeoxyribonuclease VII small subunit [Bacteroidales bacterium]
MTKKKQSYSEAIAEIESIIHDIENNKFDVDELSGKVKRVTELIRFCKDTLHKTEKDIEKIMSEID